MKIGILTLCIGTQDQERYYNAQDVGLAKALCKLDAEIIVYRLVPEKLTSNVVEINGCNQVTLHALPSRSIGKNGWINLQNLDLDLDVLICFADTQITVPKVYAWAMKHKVVFIPYIGVIESHQTNKIKRWIIDRFFRRNLKVFRKCHCVVKTPYVMDKLLAYNVIDIDIMPVGLDLDLLKHDYEEYPVTMLRQKYHYGDTEKILLFIGRMTDEKQPLRMIRLFSELLKSDSLYRLVMIGNGELKATVKTEIERLQVVDYVQLFDQIPNTSIWEVYRIADVYINLNQQEIFGMAILEAMYYGCKVIAWHAPGPDYIIGDGISGYLVENDAEVIEKVLASGDVSEKAHQRILESFLWDSVVQTIIPIFRRDA